MPFDRWCSSMRVLVLDRDVDFRLMVSQILAIEWPDVEVEEYAVDEAALQSRSFKLAEFDIVIVGCPAEDGSFDGARPFVQRRDVPATVLVGADAVNDELAGSARHAAISFLPRTAVNRRCLVAAVNDSQTRRREWEQRRNRTGSFDPQLKVTRSGNYTRYAASVNDLGIRGYRTVNEIGEGGMSRVFLARREKDGLELVLKVLDHGLTKEDGVLQRFMHEYQIVSDIVSPHVVKIYDQGFTDEHVFIAMEYFPGGDLKRAMREAFAPKRAMTLLLEIALALDVIHGVGIVHRDLKPHNVMFRADRTLALVDFGVSKLAASDNMITLDGEVLGTPFYMSPEQAQGKAVDRRADLYSLGVLFFEMLTGRKPFVASSVTQLLHKHIHEPVPALPESITVLQRLVNKLMAKRPEDRFQNSGELIAYVSDRWGNGSAAVTGATSRSA